MDNLKNKNSRSLDETLGGIFRFTEWAEEELLKKTQENHVRRHGKPGVVLQKTREKIIL